MKWAILECNTDLFRTMEWGMSKDDNGRKSLYYIDFNSHLHLFRENILSKFSQEKS